MAMNLDAVLKIAAKVTGLDDLGALQKGLVGAEKAAGAAKGGFKAMLDSGAWQAAAAAAAGLGVAMGVSVKAAIDFEESMAEVRKVVNGIDTPQGLQEIRQEIFGLSREIPITAKGFAEMYAAAGQAGIPRQELKQFATDVSKVAIAFDMTAGEAGTALAKIRTNLGLTQPELIKLADAANYLSNNMASTAPEIVEFILRSGTAGKQAGLSAEQTAAFGSAMIASGAQAEVAATSFNNMIKALSRGSSATERQIGALVKLGYGQADAAKMEQKLTQAVEEQSRQRLDTYRRETDGALKEINRRYRNQMQALEDGWDDERSAYDDALNGQLEAQVKSLNRQRDAAIEASNQRAEINKTSNRNELNAINDSYDERIDALRDANDREMKQRQRQDRDYQQQVKDQLEDQKEMEINAVQQKYEELRTIEEARKKIAIEDAKATAKAMVGELGENMAKMLQKDAIGTIRDVFNRIRALPAEMQMSVISDLFGDEARALLPLINNTQLLEQALGLVGDKSKYSGSTAKEFATRLTTTASQLQLAQNRVNELSVTFGETFLPAINSVLKVFAPLIQGMTWLITNVPYLGPAIGVVSSALVGLVALAPFISGFITLLGQLAGMGLFAKVGLAIAGFKAAFLGLLAWVGSTLVPALLAFFSGPVGWTVLAVAAVVAMAIAFRKPIGDFFVWLGSAIGNGLNAMWKWGEPIRKFWADVWNGVKDLASNAWKGIINGIKSAFRGVLQDIANKINAVGSQVNRLISAFNRLPGNVKIPMVPTLSVPAFAKGGVVSGPTLAMVGEAGPEYIVPERKAAAFAMNYLNGARGAAAIPAFAAGGFVGGNAQINVTTGPVMQQGGQQYVTVADLEKALRNTADGIYRGLRTPAGRYATGVR